MEVAARFKRATFKLSCQTQAKRKKYRLTPIAFPHGNEPFNCKQNRFPHPPVGFCNLALGRKLPLLNSLSLLVTAYRHVRDSPLRIHEKGLRSVSASHVSCIPLANPTKQGISPSLSVSYLWFTSCKTIRYGSFTGACGPTPTLAQTWESSVWPLKTRLHQRKLINLAAHPYQEAWQSRPRCRTCPSWSQTHPCDILQPKRVAACGTTLQHTASHVLLTSLSCRL